MKWVSASVGGLLVIALCSLGCGEQSGLEPGVNAVDNGASGDGSGEGSSAALPSCNSNTIEQLCTAYCMSVCESQDTFCAASQCAADACGAGSEIVGSCTDRCDSVECAKDWCVGQRITSCESFGVKTGDWSLVSSCVNKDPACVLNSCATAGQACAVHGDCCGFYGEGTLCVATGIEDQAICAPVCDEQPCAEGFRCNPTSGNVSVCVAE